MVGTEGLGNNMEMGKEWSTCDIITWQWNGGSGGPTDLGLKIALIEVQQRERWLRKREAVVVLCWLTTRNWILFGIVLRYMILSKISLASNSPIKETERMSTNIGNLMGYKGSNQKEEGRQDTGVGTPAESTPQGNSTGGQQGILVLMVGDSWWQYTMPVPKMPGAPMFQGKDVTEFMEMMESLF